MYCPVDGDEFREGITRCPEHDVDLVDDRPQIEEPASLYKRTVGFFEQVDGRMAARMGFMIILISGGIYAVSGLTAGILFGLSQHTAFRPGGAIEIAQSIQFASFPLVIGTLGMLGGAVLLRVYISLSSHSWDRSSDKQQPLDSPIAKSGFLSRRMIRVLYLVAVLFIVLWIGTGIATSWEEAKQRFTFQSPFDPGANKPSGIFLTLWGLHSAAYAGGLGSLAIIGGDLVVRAHDHLQRKGK